MVLLGLVIVIATFALIIKNYEVRLVLAISGALMALIGGDIVFALNEFVKTMTAAVVPTICAVLGFSYVMSYTKCSDHLVVALTNLLRHVPIIIVPATVVVTWLLSIALPSAAGIAAAVGALLIPMLLALGVDPQWQLLRCTWALGVMSFLRGWHLTQCWQILLKWTL